MRSMTLLPLGIMKPEDVAAFAAAPGVKHVAKISDRSIEEIESELRRARDSRNWRGHQKKRRRR